MQEFDMIDKYFRPLCKNNAFAQDLRDDAALVSLESDEDLVVSKDLIVENVHFLYKDGGAKIAANLLLSNLSDLAASGAAPFCYMIGFGKNDKIDEKFLRDFCGELEKIQDEYGLFLIGGDTVSCESELFFSVTIFGKTKKGQILSRKNACDGDLIFVSGKIGAAHLGLKLKLGEELSWLDKEDKTEFLAQHFYPKPRIELGQELLQNSLSKCACDVSDGLLADLQRICEAANLDAVVFKNKIPLACNKYSFFDLVSGGGDYELIFACKKNDEKRIFELAKKLEIDLTCVGEFKKCEKNPKIVLLDEFGKEIKIEKYGYQH